MTILRLNDRNGDVRKLQLLLNSRVSPSPNLRVDGHFGPRTAQAVTDFQASKGLVADGIVGPKTLLALGLKQVLAPTAPVISPLAPWMDIAIAELGVHEDSLPGQHNARIVECHQSTTLKATDDETPWCSSFANWVMVKAGK
jgi:lysozyme family protein